MPHKALPGPAKCPAGQDIRTYGRDRGPRGNRGASSSLRPHPLVSQPDALPTAAHRAPGVVDRRVTGHTGTECSDRSGWRERNYLQPARFRDCRDATRFRKAGSGTAFPLIGKGSAPTSRAGQRRTPAPQPGCDAEDRPESLWFPGGLSGSGDQIRTRPRSPRHAGRPSSAAWVASLLRCAAGASKRWPVTECTTVPTVSISATRVRSVRWIHCRTRWVPSVSQPISQLPRPRSRSAASGGDGSGAAACGSPSRWRVAATAAASSRLGAHIGAL